MPLNDRDFAGLARRHWLILAATGGFLLVTMTTNVVQRMFIFYPSKIVADDPGGMGLPFIDVHATTEDGVILHGWYVPRTGAGITFLLLHGNAGNISHRLGWIALLRRLEAHVLIFDYRGYGKSEGKPSEKGLYKDATAVYEWWRREHAPDKGRLVLIGESLGGAVAVDLAARVPVDAIVVQSSFSTGRDMAKTMFPLGLLQPLTGIRFDSAAKISRVDCPKLFIHGDRDEIVPLRLGRKLYDSAPDPKEFWLVAGAGHNDLLAVAGNEYMERLRSFLKKIS